VYDIADIVSGRRVLNVDVKHESEPKWAEIKPATLTAHRFQTGSFVRICTAALRLPVAVCCCWNIKKM